MAKQDQLYRYILIIRKLQAAPYRSFEQICLYLEQAFFAKEWGLEKDKPGFSIRTFQRDLELIRNLFGYEIVYSKKHKGYYIDESQTYLPAEQLRILESMELMSAINFSMGLKPGMQLETRHAEGTELLMDIVRCIENQYELSFAYEKYETMQRHQRRVKPLQLKEFRYRWYLLAIDVHRDRFRIFALDRIHHLQPTRHKFQLSPQQHAQLEAQVHSYGITSFSELPEQVVLSFTPIQGRYVKSLPLHASQDLIVENEQEYRISLQVHITAELKMDILGFGAEVTVLEPARLAAEIGQMHAQAAAKYQRL